MRIEINGCVLQDNAAGRFSLTGVWIRERKRENDRMTATQEEDEMSLLAYIINICLNVNEH